MALSTDNAATDIIAAAIPIASSIAFPTSVVTGDALVLAIGQVTTESMTITDISGTVNATGWTLLGSMVDHSATNLRTFVYGKISEGAGTETVTITYGGTYNGMLGVCCISTSAGAITFGQTATVAEYTSSTNLDSNTIDSGANVGGVLAIAFTGGDQSVTADGAGETDVSDEFGRIHFVWEPYASAGVKGIEATSGGNASSLVHLVELIEAVGGGGSSVPVFRRHYQTMKQ